jgi:hypothetical protein
MMIFGWSGPVVIAGERAPDGSGRAGDRLGEAIRQLVESSIASSPPLPAMTAMTRATIIMV